MNEKFLENDAAKKIQINNNKEEESKISSTSIIEK